MRNTKVILTQDVDNLGVSGDVVSVKLGYARNLLFPRKMAHPWSEKAQKQIDQMVAARRRREIATAEDARAVRDAIEAAEAVVVYKRAGENGALFGSVSAADVAAAVKEQLKQVIDRRKVTILTPMKSVGTYTVRVKLHDDVTVDVRVDVKPEK